MKFMVRFFVGFSVFMSIVSNSFAGETISGARFFQSFYEMESAKNRTQILEKKLNLKEINKLKLGKDASIPQRLSLEFVFGQPQIALISTQHHSMLAIITIQEQCLFFDPNEGFYQTDSIEQLALLISCHLNSYYNGEFTDNYGDKIDEERVINNRFILAASQNLLSHHDDLNGGICHSLSLLVAKIFFEIPHLALTRESLLLKDLDPLSLAQIAMKQNEYERAVIAYQLFLKEAELNGAIIPDWAIYDSVDDVDQLTRIIEKMKKQKAPFDKKERALYNIARCRLKSLFTCTAEDSESDDCPDEQDPDKPFLTIRQLIHTAPNPSALCVDICARAQV